jgi:ribosomal-protein-alanine N-acetyltransferase
MKVFAETDRILMRELVREDVDAFFEMDSDPEVHTYLGKSAITSKQEALDMIDFIRQQYLDYGIGRWAIVDKASNEFVGWGGLKFRTDTANGYTDFHEVGYRLLRKHWGKGYATESAKASLKYAFEVLNLEMVYAMANIDNAASINALQKAGFRISNRFKFERILCDWFEISKQDWEKQTPLKL